MAKVYVIFIELCMKWDYLLAPFLSTTRRFAEQLCVWTLWTFASTQHWYIWRFSFASMKVPRCIEYWIKIYQNLLFQARDRLLWASFLSK